MTVLSKRLKKQRKYKLRPWVYVALVIIVISFVIGIISLIITSTKNPIKQKYIAIIYTMEYEEFVTKYAKEYGVDQNLIYAVIKTESDFDPNAVSEMNARGLMQITKDTFDWISMKMNNVGEYEFEDLHDPELGIKYGTYLLSYLIDEFEEYEVALSAYHAGRGIVNTWLSDKTYSKDGKTLDTIPYTDTAHYVDKVMTAYEGYLELTGQNKTKEIQITQ